jgi:uncharacterized protein
MTTPVVDLEPQNQELVCTILHRHLPASTKVWVFGSRVKGTARKYSDLDLVIERPNQAMTLELLSDMAADFEESNLPIKVDIVDWRTLTDDFKGPIDNEKIPLDL